MKQSELVSDQFSGSAQGYLTSDVHANGADLQRLNALTRYSASQTALDLGCGAGHTSFAMAKEVAAVTAYDLSAEMLVLVESEAVRRGLTNITTQQGSAEHLPFADASFDLVATRFSTHHWSNVPAAMSEVRRVLKPTGILVLIDTVSPENPLFDTVLQTVEILADASHIRDYRVSEWHAMLNVAGFEVLESDSWTLPMAFSSWIGRKQTSELRADTIRDVFAKSSDEVRQYFKVQADCSFDLDVVWLMAKYSRQIKQSF